MWIGATSGLAGLKFSTSPSMFGAFEVNIIMDRAITTIGSVSLMVNIGLNFTFSMLVTVLVGFDDPFSCSRIRCLITIAAIIIGSMKCREKNRFSVGWDTEGPPQIQVTRSFPTSGIADRTPVMTVAPQNDICPQGRTYPRKAVAITDSIISIPDSHTLGLFAAEVKYIPRAVWMYIRMKNKEAPFMWTIRVTHPVLMSRMIITITIKACSVFALYIIDRINPDPICRVRVIPNRNPMFHNMEIDVGVGRSSSAFFTIDRIGLVFISWFFIRMMNLRFGLGCVRFSILR